jgi:hypothetical protein
MSTTCCIHPCAAFRSPDASRHSGQRRIRASNMPLWEQPRASGMGLCGARPVEGNFCYCRPRDSPLVAPVPTPSAHCRPCDLRRWRHKMRRSLLPDGLHLLYAPAVLALCPRFLLKRLRPSPLPFYIAALPQLWALSSPLSSYLLIWFWTFSHFLISTTCVCRASWHDSPDCRRSAIYNECRRGP